MMSIPAETMDMIWGKLSIAYGHRFLSIWDGFPMEQVKADWANTLGDLSDEALMYGLQHLPAGRPPEAMEFRQICRRLPDPAQASLPHLPKRGPVPEFAQKVVEQFKADLTGDSIAVQWARGYVERFGGEGQGLSPDQRKHLARARRVLAGWQADKDLAAKKAEVQASVDAVMEHDSDTD